MLIRLTLYLGEILAKQFSLKDKLLSQKSNITQLPVKTNTYSWETKIETTILPAYMGFSWVFGCLFSVNRRIYGYYFLVITYSEIINVMQVSPQVPDWQVI